MPSRIVILKTGSTFPDVAEERGDYEAWIARGLDVDTDALTTIDASRGVPLPRPREVAALVVTGSAAMVTDRADWSVAAGRLIADVVSRGVPVLAICYGHQLLADALGGEVGDNPQGRQIGTVAITLSNEGIDDVLLGPAGHEQRYQVVHRQSVLRLPEGAVHLASTPDDDNYAYRIGERAWAVQFHPEFDALALTTYIERRSELIREEGGDPDALLSKVHDSDHGPALLARFARLI